MKDSRATSAAAASSSSLTLMDLWALANEWCPKKASWTYLLDNASWGCAHELGHALIEPAHRWVQRNYGRCSIGHCRCRGEACDVHEAAAMRISAALLAAVGRLDLVDAEVEATNDYDLIIEESWRRSKALLKRKKLWPVPRTRRSLEAALRRRLGRPRGRRQRPSANPPVPKTRGSAAMGMFANMLYNPGLL